MPVLKIDCAVSPNASRTAVCIEDQEQQVPSIISMPTGTESFFCICWFGNRQGIWTLKELNVDTPDLCGVSSEETF